MADRLPILPDYAETAVPVYLVGAEGVQKALAGLGERERRFAEAQGFKGESGRTLVLPDDSGAVGGVLFGLGSEDAAERSPMLAGKLASALPEGTYRLSGAESPDLAALAFALGSYRFDRYRKPKANGARLVAPEGADFAGIARVAEGVYLVRDLINTPSNDLGPEDLARAAGALAQRFGATYAVISGEQLEREFPMVHAVGKSSDRAPCLIDMRWGAESDPKVTLVGKGIVFDTGGLDIKPASGMLTMKKDMGGAANVLGLASMIMDAGLKVRLRVILPVAENAISGRAFRPGDVLRSRKGLTVEVGNTDAEGRLVLADGLALADEEAPELLVTMATLTGAARVALGPEVPPFYTDDDAFAAELSKASEEVADPVWRLPFYKPYDSWLSSKIADMNNIAGNAFAGSIVAALFLRRFVSAATTFAHFDIFAWSQTPRATGPEGGDAQAIRALFHHLSRRYG
jgi:leucyl aminopeptidase